MSDTAPRLLDRLFRRPLRDRRLRRADWQRTIADAALSAEAKVLIKRVVSRTRLWHAEKADVAAELIAHFSDAAEAGVSTADAIAAFGNPKQAAKLIRRAKVRNRPLIWHALKWVRRGAMGIIALYLILGVYYITGRPTPSVDYVAVLNQPILVTPADQNAWPIYRDLLVRGGTWDDAPDTWVPTDDVWPASKAWVDQHQDLIEEMRRGAKKPALGFVMGYAGSIADPKMAQFFNPVGEGAPPEVRKEGTPQPILSVMCPHWNDLRTMARCLGADAQVGVDAGDGSRATKDLLALHGMADQTMRQGFIVGDMVALGIRQIANDLLDRALATRPEVFSDNDLRDLSHRIAGPRVTADLVELRGERAYFADVVQRVYTDDGHGNGRITPEGMRYLQYLNSLATDANGKQTSSFAIETAHLLGPPATMLMASRRELMEMNNRLIERAEAAYRLPSRMAKGYGDEEIQAMQQDKVAAARFYLILLLTPSRDKAAEAVERYLGVRDGLQIAMALELYRRQTGSYPATLDALAPRCMPRVPVDPISGGPLKYKLVDGKPLIYSVGSDGDDDGGRPPMDDGKIVNITARG